MTQEQASMAASLITKIKLLQQSIDRRGFKIKIEPHDLIPQGLKDDIKEFQSNVENLWIEFADEKIKSLNAELEAL